VLGGTKQVYLAPNIRGMDTFRITDTNNNDAELKVFKARDARDAEILGKEHAYAARVIVYRLWAQQQDGEWLAM
jgi:hypothetical protein